MPLDTAKIRKLRLKLGLSMAAAAKAARISGGGGDWWRIEKGKKSNLELATIERIAAVLKTTAKDLLK